MKTIRAFLKSHPLISYFVLTFAITWSLFVFAVGGPGSIPATKEEFTTLPLLAILAVLVGPSVSGLAMTGFLYGREGFRNLLTRLTRWRVGARWYALALLTAPLVSQWYLSRCRSSPRYSSPAYSHPRLRCPWC